VLYAAEKYGAAAAGCTLSRQQFEYATSLVHRRGLDGRVQVFERDYRDLRGRYDRIASIGMFEHVGRRRLRAYLEKVYSLLACDGLFLNHGIMRPQTISENPASVFWRRNLFPGAELVHLSDVLREAKRVGFELLDVENLRRPLRSDLPCLGPESATQPQRVPQVRGPAHLQELAAPPRRIGCFL
jgi:cyclopropane-fatty-acyl-phospholipid synthase